MDLADDLRRQTVEVGLRAEAEVAGADENVVDVEQQAAACLKSEFRKEVRLAQLMARQIDVEGRVLDQEPASERVLDAGHVVGDLPEGPVGPWKGQEVVQMAATPALPCQMVRNRHRTHAPGKLDQSAQVRGFR